MQCRSLSILLFALPPLFAPLNNVSLFTYFSQQLVPQRSYTLLEMKGLNMPELVKRDYGADLTICHGYSDSVEIGLRRCVFRT